MRHYDRVARKAWKCLKNQTAERWLVLGTWALAAVAFWALWDNRKVLEVMVDTLRSEQRAIPYVRNWSLARFEIDVSPVISLKLNNVGRSAGHVLQTTYEYTVADRLPDCQSFGQINGKWPAPGSKDTELGVLMEPEVSHGETEIYSRVQA